MLLHWDSFDDRSITAIGDRYESHQYNLSAGSAIGPGRTGNALVLSSGILDVNDRITWESPTTHQSLYVGIAWGYPGFATALCSIRYNGTPQIFAQLNSNNTISVIRYDAGANTVLATSGRTVPTSGFFYVELYGKIHSSAGAYELRVNGTRWLSASGVNTSSTGHALANQVRIIFNLSGNDGQTANVDDFYITDDDTDSGRALHVGFLGPVKIACVEEESNGASVEWSAFGGSNYENIDETTGQDGDTTYNYSATDEAVDTFAVADLAAPGARIQAVGLTQWAKREDALYRGVVPIARVSGVEYAGDEVAMTNSYGRVSHAFERNPATLAAWTLAEVNAAQFGYQASTAA